MNNFKWHSFVGKCKMDFPITTRIASFENSFCYTKSWGAEEPRKTSHMHKDPLVMLEVVLKSHEHLGTSQCQYKKLSLCVDKL
jgi:hypothetical protein